MEFASQATHRMTVWLQRSIHASDQKRGQDAQRGAFFLVVMLAAIACLGMYIPINYFFYPTDLGLQSASLFMLGISLCFLQVYLLWGWRQVLSLVWYVLLVAGIVLYDLPDTGGLRSPDTTWLYLSAAVLCMMGDMVTGVSAAILLSILLLVLYNLGIWADAPLPASSYFVGTYILQGGFTVLMVAWFNSLRRMTAAEARRRKADFEAISRQLMGSIQYAHRIREGILPAVDFSSTPVTDFARLDAAKSPLSGDFFYVRAARGKHFIALCDCTGHGVPGGFISALGICFLDEAILGLALDEPKDILAYIRRQFVQKVRPTADDLQDDGMVTGLVVLDTETPQLRIASSQISVKLKTDTGWVGLMPSRYPLAFHPTNNLPFEQTNISLQRVSEIFMSTDGLADQLSEEGKRYSKRRLIHRLENTMAGSLEEGMRALSDDLKSWQGAAPQTDDILAVWLRLDNRPKG